MPAPRSSDTKSRKAAKPALVASPAAAASTKPDSKGKKRVRVVEPEEPEAAPETASVVEAPTSKGKKSKKAAAAADEARKDLRDKDLAEIVPVVSADVLGPAKSSLKKSPKKSAAVVAPVEEDVVAVEDEPEIEELDFLKGFESASGEDSSDEEGGDEDEAMFKLDDLPVVSKEDAGVQKKLQAKAERKKNVRLACPAVFSSVTDST